MYSKYLGIPAKLSFLTVVQYVYKADLTVANPVPYVHYIRGTESSQVGGSIEAGVRIRIRATAV